MQLRPCTILTPVCRGEGHLVCHVLALAGTTKTRELMGHVQLDLVDPILLVRPNHCVSLCCRN